MADQRSPLISTMTPGRHGGMSGRPGVSICENRVGGLAQIVGWESFAEELSRVYNLTKPLSYNTRQTVGDFTFFRIAPERVQVHHPDAVVLAQRCKQLDAQKASYVDLGHARCRLCLSGSDAEQVLSRVTTLDVDVSAFPAGDFRQSGIHHIATFFHRTAEHEFELFVPTTWAVSVFEYIYDAALSFGVDVTPIETHKAN